MFIQSKPQLSVKFSSQENIQDYKVKLRIGNSKLAKQLQVSALWIWKTLVLDISNEISNDWVKYSANHLFCIHILRMKSSCKSF